jgi:hypothetical protein
MLLILQSARVCSSIDCVSESSFGPEQFAQMGMRVGEGPGLFRILSARFSGESLHASLAKSFRVHDPFVAGNYDISWIYLSVWDCTLFKLFVQLSVNSCRRRFTSWRTASFSSAAESGLNGLGNFNVGFVFDTGFILPCLGAGGTSKDGILDRTWLAD